MPVQNECSALRDSIHNNTQQLLQQPNDAGICKHFIDQLVDKLAAATGISAEFDMNDWQSAELATGVAISPVQAAKCVKEILRTQIFLKGVHQCFQDKLAQKESINVLYAGTGPYGMLVIPLLHLFRADQVKVWLLDIHPKNIDALTTLTRVLGISDRVAFMGVADATRWRPDGEVRFDVLVSETMTALLAREPQVSIFAHLQRYLADDGEFIPQQIVLGTELAAADSSGLPPIKLGSFFQLNRKTCQDIADGNNSCLSGTIPLPDDLSTLNYQSVSFTTDIQVYSEHWLRKNQCSLNMPLSHNGLKLVKGGEIRFEYIFSDSPGYVFDITKEILPDSLPPKQEGGRLGVSGLKRFWHKMRLLRDNQLNQSVIEAEFQIDRELLESLSLDYHQTLSFVCQRQPGFYDFEDWVVEQGELTQRQTQNSKDYICKN
ncbi:class I SAM-dependent methyltransferase [Vibrio parahaemolyticus]|nr:class I SAM-dependent methyltransferase [Vibrio parahaemolyticus]EIU6800280.1 class I SAM-dependent methyltransferase [Vibrio parahaemolyticus]